MNLPSVDMLSGIQPTGRLHLGNYLGAVREWVKIQENENLFVCLVDYHALTAAPLPDSLRAQTRSLLVDLLACGLDPEESVLFCQSDLPEHIELFWILSCVARFGEMARMTQFKDKGGGTDTESVGLGVLNYPVLQAADILLYGPNKVPVGEDQAQHLELTRELLRRFNKRYTPLFQEVRAHIPQVGKVLSLNQPSRKMSKSDPTGCVFIDEEAESLLKKVKRAVTDSGQGALSPGVLNLLGILASFNAEEGKKAHKEAEGGQLRYGDLKVAVAGVLEDALSGIREEKRAWLNRPDRVEEILQEGAKAARRIAQPRLAAIRDVVGLKGYPR
ncbi:tryptophan--tRNA ligase [bacterium]|nr:tryptophan--tRNA ligase [bacterium]